MLNRIANCLAGLLTSLVLFSAMSLPALANSSTPILMNEVSFREDGDWVELFVTKDYELDGVRLYEGSGVLIKELPAIDAIAGDFVVIHLDSEEVEDEDNSTGKGDNGYWDIYSDDTGLIATDDILRLQIAGSKSPDDKRTLDAVIWSNADGFFSSSKSTANDLCGQGHWDEIKCGVSDFSESDIGAVVDSDEVFKGGSIGRVQVLSDTNSVSDWKVFTFSTKGDSNADITPTPTIFPTPTPTPVLVASPTPTYAPTPIPNTIQIEYSIPTQFDLNDEVQVLGKVNNAQPSVQYNVKFEASSDETNWYDGRTLGTDGSYLAWNASWSKFPIFSTDKNGDGSFEVTVKLSDGVEPGNYSVRLKLREISTGKMITSDTFTINQVETEIVDSTDVVEEVIKEKGGDDNSQKELTSYQYLISEIRELEIGTVVRVEGVVTAEPELLGSRVMYIEDESGGVKILLDRKDRDDIKYQDKVRVIGKIGESFNELNLKVEEAEGVTVLGQGDLPDPLSIETGRVGEGNEGELLKVNGEVVATSGNTFYVDDGSGEVKVYIKDSTEIDKPPMRTGYFSQVTGVNSQYKDDYRILPRFIEDLVVSQAPIVGGDVLGVSEFAGLTELPQTGFGHSDIGLVMIMVGLVLRQIKSSKKPDE